MAAAAVSFILGGSYAPPRPLVPPLFINYIPSEIHQKKIFTSAVQGTSSRIDYDPCLAGVISKTNILVVEGYLLELPDTIKTIIKACEVARSSGALVAVTASDIFCIVRHYDNFWEILENYVYSFFANTDEVRAFCHFSSKESPIASTRYLSHFIPLVSVTDGSRGSYIGIKGEAVYIPPTPRVPVWTLVAQGCICFGYSVCVGTCDS